jgi:hypothetical protein
MFITRTLGPTLQRFAKFPVVVLLGPRQSGKTTLAQHTFSNHLYFSLEDPATLDHITKDPQGFLAEYENQYGIIFDEFQHFPQLLSYLQIISDNQDRPGYFVLTGSQNFLVNQAVTQSLAGRAGILYLLPLSIHEVQLAQLLPEGANQLIMKGGYPRTYAKDFAATEFYPAYINTYVERDARQLVNIANLHTFRQFMQLCAGRIGQQLNITDLATNCGIARTTAEQWLSILEASYIIFLLRPYFNNFNKRVNKLPKLYFYDTGLACALLGIQSAKEVMLSPFRGPLFECLVITDFYKQYYNLGFGPQLYYWRDKNGRIEVDCLIDQGLKLIPVKIKSGATINSDFFESLQQWGALAVVDPALGYIVYGGDSEQKRAQGQVIGWQKAGSLILELEGNRERD